MTTDPLLKQDCQKLLKLLQEAPRTHTELITAMRLSSARITSILEILQQRGQIHSPRYVTGQQGRTIEIWELKHTFSAQD